MANPNVDEYTKTLNHRKILRKAQQNNLLKIKRTLKQKNKLSGDPVFTVCLRGRAIRPSACQ